MTNLKFGVIYRVDEDNDPGDFAAQVEQLGFDSVWVGEHIANHWWTVPTVIPVLGAFAARTRRVAVASGVLLLPLRQPVLIAKELATLDQISHGRLVVGVGLGGDNPAELSACDVPMSERASRADEILNVVTRLWREDNVTFHGRHFNVEAATIAPKPVQAGGPRILVAGRKEAGMRRAVRYGQGFLPYLYEPQQYAAAIQYIREHAREVGRDIAEFEFALYQTITVGNSKEEARRLAFVGSEHIFRQKTTDVMDRFFVLGSPADCIARLNEYVKAGVNHLAFDIAGPPAMRAEQLSIIAGEIVPEILKGI